MSYYGYYSDSNEDIAHYGVKGMKWGIRKAGSKAKDAFHKTMNIYFS